MQFSLWKTEWEALFCSGESGKYERAAILNSRTFSPSLTGEMYLVSKRYQTFNKAAMYFKEILLNESEKAFIDSGKNAL